MPRVSGVNAAQAKGAISEPGLQALSRATPLL